MATQIQIRRDTGANWASSNPILGDGELGIDSTVGQFKIGDGATAWTSLSYHVSSVAPAKSVSSSTTAGALTLTAAQLAGSYFVDGATQTAAFTLTTDTAANLLAQMPTAAVGSSFEFRIINNDQSTSGYAATLAAGTGVTLSATPLVAPSIPKGGVADFVGVFTDVTAAAAAVTIYAVGGYTGALL